MPSRRGRAVFAALLISLFVAPALATEPHDDAGSGRSSASDARTIEELRAELRAQARRIDELEAANDERFGEVGSAIRELTNLIESTPAEGRPAVAGMRTKKGLGFDLYGFIRVDASYDDARFQSNQLPGWVLSQDSAAPAGVGAPRDEDDFNLHPRLTRIGLDFHGGRMAGQKGPDVAGKIEIDFYGGGSQSRSLFRMRKAYVTLTWDELQVLAGQTTDLISPLYPSVNNDLVMWGAGNLGDRRPQVRATYTPKSMDGKVTFAGMMGLTGAIDGNDLDFDGFRDGETSSKPTFQGRIAYKGEAGKDRPYTIGLWGHRAWEDPTARVAGQNEFDSSAIGIDVQIVVVPDTLTLKGEAWKGKNLDDVRGGIFQGVNAATGTEVESKGGWVEAIYRAAKNWTLHAGYALDDPDSSDVGTNGRDENEIIYVATRWTTDYGVGYGVEFLRWDTDYVGLSDGTANRVLIYITYAF